MTATFTNSRLSSLPCERMRGSLIFAEDFVSSARVEENHGTITGATVNRGAVFSGSDSIVYSELTTSDNLSLVVKFNLDGSGDLFDNLSGSAAGGYSGIEISIDSEKITITADGTLSIDGNFLDSEDHTLTLSISDSLGSLHVDNYDAITGAMDVNVSSEDITIGTNITGTISSIRVFDNALTEDDHLNYYNNTLTSFMSNALATYRCDSVGNDTNGNKIWDKQSTLNDLYKADRSTTSAFPTFDTDKYSFDYIDDYISNVPTLTDGYTVSAVVQSPYALTPSITQENDSTLLTELSTAGNYYGYLYNLILHTGVLTAIQLLHSEFQQLYYTARGYAVGLYSRLIVEGTCKAFLHLSKSYFNWSIGGAGIATGVTQSDDGVIFVDASSNITIADDSDLRVLNGSIIIDGIFNGASGNGLVDKLGNYKFSGNATQLDFNGSVLAYVPSNNTQLAVTWKDGYKPRFYADGDFIGEGDTVVNITSTGTSDIIIGNVAALNSNCPYTINNVYIGDEPLTDYEILAMFNQSKIAISEPEFISLQSTVDSDIILQSTVDGDPILQSTVI